MRKLTLVLALLIFSSPAFSGTKDVYLSCEGTVGYLNEQGFVKDEKQKTRGYWITFSNTEKGVINYIVDRIIVTENGYEENWVLLADSSECYVNRYLVKCEMKKDSKGTDKSPEHPYLSLSDMAYSRSKTVRSDRITGTVSELQILRFKKKYPKSITLREVTAFGSRTFEGKCSASEKPKF